MENSIRINVSRQMALRNNLDTIAQNIANQTTTGYRSVNLKFSEYIMPNARANEFMGGDKRVSYVLDDSNVLDLTHGSLMETGNPLNAAISGKGWFVVQTPEGERITRDGSFEVNNEGILVNSSGLPILGTGGEINIGAASGELTISKSGEISDNNNNFGQLKIVDFDANTKISPEGANLYSFSTAYQELEFPNVHQGMLETSNVRPINEISRLVHVTRAYSTVSDLIKQQDKLRNEAINRLGNLSA